MRERASAIDLLNGHPTPASWNEFILIPILKQGKDPTLPSSYRPIAPASCLRKTFQKVVKGRLEWWAETERLLDRNQNGFRAGRSVTDNTGHLVVTALSAYNKNRVVSAFFADVRGAFDNVPVPSLIAHLRRLGCPDQGGSTSSLPR